MQYSFLGFSVSKMMELNLDMKEDVEDADIIAVMDSIVDNKLVKTESSDLVEKVAAQIVNREVTKVNI